MVDSVRPVPEFPPTLTARLIFEKNAAAAAEFYEKAFGAVLREEPHRMPDGTVVHAEIQLGDSVVYLADESGDGNGAAPPTLGGRVTALMAMSVSNVDEMWERAVGAGCDIVYPLADQFYGDRAGRLRDPFGHQWMLRAHIEDVSREELDRRMQAFAGGAS